LRPIVAQIAPPERIDPLGWARRYRWLSGEDTAEKGKFRIERTPYMAEIMRAYADPKIWKIALGAGAQVGKTTLQTNLMAWAIDTAPGPMLYGLPSEKDAIEFSRTRFDPMARDCPRLRKRIRIAKSRDSSNTLQVKMYPGGYVKFVGTNVPNALAGKPIKYFFGDDIDRFSENVGGSKDGFGGEGDAIKLCERRLTTYLEYGAKAFISSTPTVKGHSAIEREYNLGTMERWKTRCPNCEEYHEIVFEGIECKPIKEEFGDAVKWRVENVVWRCPDCGFTFTEEEMRRQPCQWEANNPGALESGVRSFWLNAFASPWVRWDDIMTEWFQAQGNPAALQTVCNTLLGKLWEQRGETQSEEALISRREDYGKRADESPVELPAGVLALTCGVDCHGDRLEYEVVGWGKWDECWGIKYGVIPYNVSENKAWEMIDELLARNFYFADGKALKIAATCIDSGYMTRDVYRGVYDRRLRGIAAIKGDHGPGKDFLPPAHRAKKAVSIDGATINIPFYAIGVDEGKAVIMYNLSVKTPGAKYCHFPLEESAGYDHHYFSGLLSEKFEQAHTGAGLRGRWVKIEGHERNEPLDCRNYALAAYKLSRFDMQAIENALREQRTGRAAPEQAKQEMQKWNVGVPRESVSPDFFSQRGYNDW